MITLYSNIFNYKLDRCYKNSISSYLDIWVGPKNTAGFIFKAMPKPSVPLRARFSLDNTFITYR